MYEAAGLEGLVGRGEWKSGGSGGDHFLYRETGALDFGDDLHQAVVTAMGLRFALGQILGGHMAVVVMQSAEREGCGGNRAGDVDNCGRARLLDTGAIHP